MSKQEKKRGIGAKILGCVGLFFILQILLIVFSLIAGPASNLLEGVIGNPLLDDFNTAFAELDCARVSELSDEINDIRRFSSDQKSDARNKVSACSSYERGASALANGNYDDALHDFFYVVRIDPENTTGVFEEIATIFDEQPLSNLTNRSCSYSDSVAKIEAIQDDAPAYYLACARYHESEDRSVQAIYNYNAILTNYPESDEAEIAGEVLVPVLYETGRQASNDSDAADWKIQDGINALSQIVNDFPDHELADNAARYLAQLEQRLGADTQSSSDDSDSYPGILEQPPGSSISGGQAIVVIQNGSSRALDASFSGPQFLSQEINPCLNCGLVTNGCSSNAPSQIFHLNPGSYELRVSAIARDVTSPYGFGLWELEAGMQYEICLYIDYNP